MGMIYEAEDAKLRRSVAIKLLPPDLVRHPEARQRFVQEAQAASALNHANICTIFEIKEEGFPFYHFTWNYEEVQASYQINLTIEQLQQNEVFHMPIQVTVTTTTGTHTQR